jgi:hypothetical protein
MCQPGEIGEKEPSEEPVRLAGAATALRFKWPAGRRFSASWLTSAAFHVAVGAVVLLADNRIGPLHADSGPVELNAIALPSQETSPAIATLTSTPDSFGTQSLAGEEIARLAREATTLELQAALLDESPTVDSWASQWVQARVLVEVAAAEKTSRVNQLQRLAALSGELKLISSEDSVDAATARLAAMLGTETRAEAPAAEPVAGEFHFPTAQVHDVRRTEPEPGRYEYAAILLDAQGRTLETPLSPAEGEQLYKVMELVRSNPLLDRIYRGVVMSLLDKVLKPAASDPPASHESEHAEAQ